MKRPCRAFQSYAGRGGGATEIRGACTAPRISVESRELLSRYFRSAAGATEKFVVRRAPRSCLEALGLLPALELFQQASVLVEHPEGGGGVRAEPPLLD